MIKVYGYCKWDITTGGEVRAPSKATAEWIEQTESQIIPGTEEEVSEADLDGNGVHRPRAPDNDLA